MLPGARASTVLEGVVVTVCGAVLLPVALLDLEVGRLLLGAAVAVCARRQAGRAGGRTGAPMTLQGHVRGCVPWRSWRGFDRAV